MLPSTTLSNLVYSDFSKSQNQQKFSILFTFHIVYIKSYEGHAPSTGSPWSKLLPGGF